ncbi:MAG: radical SAM protein [Candidatus Omnitrophica bacterium]|nr:radical SAM protein [Candidatus Omnitrophota bacterium]
MDKRQISQRECTVNRIKHWVRLTRVCNNRCIFCLDKEAQDGSCIPMGDIERDLACGQKDNTTKVILSGGEPTLHPKFFEIVRLTKKLGVRDVQVITNGRMFMYNDFLAAAVKAGVSEITFSIHGHNQRLHDRQTQVKGSFNQSLSGLRNALKIPNLIVNADIVINKFNVRHLSDILKFLINVGVLEFDLLQVIPFGRAWDNRERVFYNIEESLTHLRQAFQLSKNRKLHLWTNRFPAKYLEGFEELIQHPVKLYDEIRGRKELFEQFFDNGHAMDCMGERCRHCFLENFCRDLIEFKSKGSLGSKNIPFCLGRTKNKKVRYVENYRKYILKNDKVNIFEFLSFYIKNRYFIKSLKCNECKFNATCQGAYINHIRHNGFELLKPIR